MPATSSPPERIRLAIVTTHPIQYYAPVFRTLAQSGRMAVRVFYTWSQSASGDVFDPGFGSRVTWDIPLLQGYDHVFVPNVAKRPGSSHYLGIQNPELIEMITAWSANAVLIYAWNLRSHLEAMRRLKGRIPVLFRGDSTLLGERTALRSALRKRWLRWVYSHVDVAIAVGTNNRDYFLWAGVPPERVAYAPHSVDTRRFAGDVDEHSRRARGWRVELAIDPQAIVFVFAAKLIPIKDPFLLLDAFGKLQSRAHLIFFGDGELLDDLRERCGGRTDVHFLPFQNQRTMPAVYRVGDVYVLPSRSETWGLAMNEAMACGRPLIASSRVGGARDLIEEGVTGWQFAVGDTDDLARALRLAIAAGRAGLREMGERAKARVENWSTDATARGIADAVEQATSERAERPAANGSTSSTRAHEGSTSARG